MEARPSSVGPLGNEMSRFDPGDGAQGTKLRVCLFLSVSLSWFWVSGSWRPVVSVHWTEPGPWDVAGKGLAGEPSPPSPWCEEKRALGWRQEVGNGVPTGTLAA